MSDFVSCIQSLLQSGADLKKLDHVKNEYLQSLSATDAELKKFLP